MNNLMKRILSLALALVLVLALVPTGGVHVHATEADEIVAIDPVEVPVEEPVEEPTEEPAEEPVEEPEEEPADEEELIVEEVPMVGATFAMTKASNTLTLGVEGLVATHNGNQGSAGSVTWTVPSGNAISCTATGSTILTGKSTLTLTNNMDEPAKLKFDWTLSAKHGLAANNGSVSGAITGSGATSGQYEAEIPAKGSITITFTSMKATTKATLDITNISLVSTVVKDVNVTFKPATGGTFTANGEAVTAETTKTIPSGTEVALSAAADEGYIFVGWYDVVKAKYVSYNAACTYIVATDTTISPVFVDDTTALFGVGGDTFVDLTEAANAAASGSIKTVVLLNDGIVSGKHTIPAGVTLLIPFDAANTLYTDVPGCTSRNGSNAVWVQPTAYRTLTLAADADITVNGAISVSAKHAAGNGSATYSGAPTGPVGWVKMEQGSKVTLKSGANLYAWGFIQGSGSIVAESGATVYENFQLTDFRGGSNLLTLAMTEGMVFPINQYYVQNIEVPTTYHAGASEVLYTSMFASNMVLSAPITFMGQGGMFEPQAGAVIVKDYIENKDRLELTVNGNSALNSLTLDLGQFMAGMSVNSGTFVLSITNNITLNVNSGTTTISQSVALLPGVEVNIGKNATVHINAIDTPINHPDNYPDGLTAPEYELYTISDNGYGLIVYDANEWKYGVNMETYTEVPGYYAYQGKRLGPVVYAPGQNYTRTESDLKDAVLNINGKLIADGYLYTTTSGASIISSEKTGSIEFNGGAGYDYFTFQANEGNALGIPMNTAALCNGDGTYEYTGPTFTDLMVGDMSKEYIPAGTVYNYCDAHDKWYTGVCEPCESHVHDWSVSYAWASDLATCTAERTCNADGCRIKTESATATITSKVTTAPTCNDKGVKTYTATFTVEWAATQTKTAPVDATGHSWGDATYTWSADGKTCTAKRVCKNDAKHVETAAATITSKETTAPTCKDKGTTTYTATFAVAWATTQAKAVQDIPATGDHNYVPGEYTWSADYKTCTVVGTCGCGTSKTATANATAAQTKAPTCTAKGETTYTATFTETWAKAQTKVVDNVPALNHAWGAASYTFAADGKSCSAKRVCGNDQTHVETAAATITSAVKTPATCTAKGTTTYTATFSASWAAKQTKDVQDIAVIPHTYVAGTPAWGADNKSCTVTGTCSCGATAVANATVTSKVTKEATCYTAGETTYTATFDKAWATTATKTVKNLPATGNHSFKAGEPVWGADYEFCKVTGKCTTTGCTATAEATATSVTVKQTKAPTCCAWGENTYTATFAEAWAATVTKTVANVAPTGNHIYEAVEVIWGANYESCKVTGKCTTTGCSATTTATAAEITSEQTKAPTCADKGETTYTATFAETWASSASKTVANVPATGIHTYTEKGELKTPGTCVAEAVYAAKCKVCGTESATETIKGAKDPANHTFTTQKGTLKTAGTCTAEAVYAVKCDLCGADSADKTVKGAKDPANHASAEFAYVDNANELNHTKKHACCSVVVDAEEAHAFDATTHACVCGAVDAFILTIEDIDFAGGNEDPSNLVLEIAVPYGAKLADYIPADSYTTGDKVTVNGKYYNGTWSITGWKTFTEEDGYEAIDIETTTMPAEGLTITQAWSFTGWVYDYYDVEAEDWSDECLGIAYWIDDEEVMGWAQIAGSWYYFAEDEAQGSYYAVAGLVRAPYPTEAIDGVTYAPNADDLAYADFIDATESWFLFAEDGKFQNELTGMDTYNGAVRYINKGQIAWNPGVVKIDNNYFYFMGDTAKGGNKLVKNDVYVYRNSTDRKFNIGGIYTFAADGKLCEYNGITTVNGKVRYYENAQLMVGNGLTKVGDHFIYVLSDGRLLINSSCWVGANDLKVAEGIYKFDANGYLLNPVSTEKEGVIEEKGKLYYYENGRIAFNKGLLELADGSIIYVRSNGQVATGEYFITNVDNYTGSDYKTGDKLTFGADGKMVASKNGIIDGYYYENNNVAFNKGVIKLDGKYYYVRSNGMIVKGQNYWITNVGDSGVVAKQYTFAADGTFEPAFTNVNGIVNGYYYENGMIACGKGLVKLTDETGTYLIYVRSNGALATGVYWPTQKNGIDVAGALDFGTDGKCYIG